MHGSPTAEDQCALAQNVPTTWPLGPQLVQLSQSWAIAEDRLSTQSLLRSSSEDT